MPNPVQGKNVALSILVDASYLPILCATDCATHINRERIEKTGPNSATYRQWMIRLSEMITTVSGLTKINNDTSVTFFYMLQLGNQLDEKTFQLTFEDDENNLFSYVGAGLIGNQSINGPATDFSNASIEILWNGYPTVDTIPAPSVSEETIEALYIPVVAGEVSVHHVDLEQTGVTILQVRRNGLSQTETTGTPGNGEFKFVGGAGNGDVFTDTSIPYEVDEQDIYVLYKIV